MEIPIPDKMKIVNISYSDSGGAGIAALRLHKALLAERIDSILLCFNKSSNDKNIIEVNRPLLSRLTEHLPLPIFNNKYRKIAPLINTDYECVSFPESVDYLTHHPLVQEADIINLHWVGSHLSYKHFFNKIDKPIVWTLHDMNPFLGCAHYLYDVINFPKWRKMEDDIRHEKEKWIHQHKNISIVNLCEWMKDYASKSVALGCYPQYIIRNSIDTTIFRSYSKKAVRELIGIPQAETVLMFASQYIRNTRKGFDILLDAIKDLKNCTLLVVGILKENINTKCNVRTIGSINDEHYMALLYACSDAFVLPSREDNLPNTMVESLCCGTPVITMRNGGMADIIHNGKNGYIADAINADSFQKSIDKFLACGVSENRDTISQSAHKLFSPSVQANAYIDIYRKAISKS